MTKVYIASNMPTQYPRKLQKPSTVSQTIRDTARSFIMDSGIGDDVTNTEVLDLAHEYNADYVIGKDYLHDQDVTTESVREFLRLYESHECDSTPMIPLQPPFHEHYRDLPGHSHYVLGGMALSDVSEQRKMAWIRRFRDVEPDAYVHALGVGGGWEFTRRMARDELLDSLDCSTPELAASNGCILDSRLSQTEVRVHKGEGARRRNVPLAEFNSWQVQDVWSREMRDCGQTTIGEMYQ